MYKPVSYALRFVMIIAVAASLSLLLTQPVSTSCPYVSALSDWAVGQTLASQTCTDRACSNTLTQCIHLKGFNCRRIDRCSDTACP